jgi:hypothetical protein
MSVRTTDAFYFAKALLYAKLSRDYFDFIITESEAKYGAKQTLKGYVGRLDWINTDLTMKIQHEDFKKMYEEDLANAGAIDSMANNYVILNEENRAKLEEYSEQLIKEQKNGSTN